jgi:hypothetical protein
MPAESSYCQRPPRTETKDAQSREAPSLRAYEGGGLCLKKHAGAPRCATFTVEERLQSVCPPADTLLKKFQKIARATVHGEFDILRLKIAPALDLGLITLLRKALKIFCGQLLGGRALPGEFLGTNGSRGIAPIKARRATLGNSPCAMDCKLAGMSQKKRPQRRGELRPSWGLVPCAPAVSARQM